MCRSLFGNMVEGLSEGYTKTLTLIGVGYRAIQGNNEVTLNLGYSLPVVMPVPEGITVQVHPTHPLFRSSFPHVPQQTPSFSSFPHVSPSISMSPLPILLDIQRHLFCEITSCQT